MIGHRGTEYNEVGLVGVVTGKSETKWGSRGIGGSGTRKHDLWAVRS